MSPHDVLQCPVSPTPNISWSASRRHLSSFISFLIAPPAQAWAPPSANTAHVSPLGRPSPAVGPWEVFKKACLCSPGNAGPTIHPGRWAQSLKNKEIQRIRSRRTARCILSSYHTEMTPQWSHGGTTAEDGTWKEERNGILCYANEEWYVGGAICQDTFLCIYFHKPRPLNAAQTTTDW